MKDFSSRVMTLRDYLGKTQAEFAIDIGVTHGYIAKVETGRGSFSRKLVNRISNKFRVNILWLETGEGRMIKEEEGIRESRPPYQSSGGDSSESMATLIPKAIEILESKGVYSQALAANINAFLQAVRSEKENLARLAAFEKRGGSKDEVPAAIAADPKIE